MDEKKKKKGPAKPGIIHPPGTHPLVTSPVDPEQPLDTEEDPDKIPDEEEEPTPPYEAPPPGEGP